MLLSSYPCLYGDRGFISFSLVIFWILGVKVSQEKIFDTAFKIITQESEAVKWLLSDRVTSFCEQLRKDKEEGEQ